MDEIKRLEQMEAHAQHEREQLAREWEAQKRQPEDDPIGFFLELQKRCEA